MNTLSLNAQLAVVTGASAGIGRAAAKKLAALGMIVVVTARRKESLDELVGEIRAQGGEAHAYALDVRDRAAVARFAAWLAERFAPLAPRVLINNAGLARGFNPVQEGVLEDWEEMIDTNLKGLLYVTRALLPAMLEAEAGHIVNIGSIAGLAAYPKGNVYCATKAAVKMLTEGLNIDLLGTPLRASLVAPGMVETEFSLVRFHGDDARATKVYEGASPLVAEDIAETIAWIVQAPAHVNVSDITVYPTSQRTATLVHRRQP